MPQGNIRLSVAGVDPGELTPGQLAQARSGVEEAMADGAFGLSTGLIYVPCMYSTTDELTALCEVMQGSGRPLVIHVRNEGSLLLESLQEAALITSEAGVPLHISHFKASGRPNWDKVPSALAFLEERRAEGQDVTFDQYPYTAGSTTMLALLPPWMLQGGPDQLRTRLQDPDLRERARQQIEEGHQALGWDNMAHNAGWDGILVTAVASEANGPLEGRTVTKIAELRGTPPAEAVFDLLYEEDGSVSMVIFSMCEENVRRIMQHPYHMVGTDGLMGGKPHPRMGGTYPRILGRYVREEGVLTLPDAVRRMTSLPAQRLGLRDRGLVREGHWADLVVFDPDSVIDGNSYADPLRPPEGIHHVLVNGTPVLRGGELTGQRPGRILRA